MEATVTIYEWQGRAKACGTNAQRAVVLAELRRGKQYREHWGSFAVAVAALFGLSERAAVAMLRDAGAYKPVVKRAKKGGRKCQ